MKRRLIVWVDLGDATDRWVSASGNLTRQRAEARTWPSVEAATVYARARIGSPWEVVPA